MIYNKNNHKYTQSIYYCNINIKYNKKIETYINKNK